MGNVEKVSVALTPELTDMVRQAVASGEYASTSEVMREALRDWRFHRLQRAQAVEELGRQWDLGVASGEATDGAGAFARIRGRLAALDDSTS